MSDAILRLIPIFIFFIFMIYISVRQHIISARAKSENFSKEYYIGGRSMGGFILAMSLVATYGSVSSFLSGSGKAWETGFGWVYYASANVVAAFLVLGILGKKMALVGRRTESVTVVDVMRARYKSDLLAII